MISWSNWLIFMSSGGVILWILLVVCFCLCFLVFERWCYLRFEWHRAQKKWLFLWICRENHDSWCSQALRAAWLSEGRLCLFSRLRFIKLLTVLCPMLGLLGTVSGMIVVFDGIEKESTSFSPLSHGIAMATFPTFVGMVIAIFGVMAYSRLMRLSQQKMTLLEKELRSR